MSFGTSDDYTDTTLETTTVEDETLSTAQESVPVPALFGTRKIAGRWISRIYNQWTKTISSDSGGKKSSGSSSKTYDYFGTIAFAICEGTVDEIFAIIIDETELWPRMNAWVNNEYVAQYAGRCYGGRSWFATIAHTTSPAFAPTPLNTDYWTPYSLKRLLTVNGGKWDQINIPGYGVFRIYWGTQDFVDPYLTAAYNMVENHPQYRGICYAVLIDFKFGNERTSAPNAEVIVGRHPNQSVVVDNPPTYYPEQLTDSQANVGAMAAEVLTSQNFIGLASADLDAPSFQAVAEKLDAHKWTAACSPLLDEQRTVRSLMDDLSGLTDIFLRHNPATDKIEAGIFTHGVTPATYQTLTIDDLTDKPNFSGEGWANVKTEAVVTFSDRTRVYKSSSELVSDARAYHVVQEHRQLSLQRDWITRRFQAVKHARETLRAIGRPPLTGDISVRREKARTILPGDWVLLDIDLEPGGAQLLQYFRVIDRTIPRRGPIKLKLDADQTLAPIPYDDSNEGGPEEDLTIPALTNVRIVEAPVLLAGSKGSRVLALARRSDPRQTGFQVLFDTVSAGAYQVLGVERAFGVKATLRSDATDSTTTLEISTAAAQPDISIFSDTVSALLAANDTLLAILLTKDGDYVGEDADDYSKVEVCSISNIANPSGGAPDYKYYDLTVLRARQKTTARAFVVASAEVWIIYREQLTALTHARFETVRGNRITGDTPATGFFKLAPFSATVQRDPDDCDAIEFRWPKAAVAGPKLTLTTPSVVPVLWPPDFNTANSYLTGNFVWSSSASYKAKIDNPAPSTAPPNATYWDAAGAYPVDLTFAGSWADPTSDMTAFQIMRQKSGAAATQAFGETFQPIDVYAFSEPVQIPESGTWFARLIGVDASGLRTTRVVTITARDTVVQVAKPEFWFRGIKQGNAWNLQGTLQLKCATPGATIKFYYQSFQGTTFKWRYPASGWLTYDPATAGKDNVPIAPRLLEDDEVFWIHARAEKAAMTNSTEALLGIWVLSASWASPW